MGHWHAHPKPHPNKWGALAAASFALFAIAISSTGITDVLTDMGNDLNTSTSEQTWIINAYMLVVAAFVVAGGQLGDIYGRRKMFVIGVCVFMAGSVLIAIAGNTDGVIAGRVVQGMGAAAIMPATLSIIDVAFPPRQRSLAFGVWGAVIGIGFALGPLVGGLLTELLSWHWLFWINVPICATALSFAFWAVSESRDEGRSRSVDFIGIAILAIAMFAIVLGLDQGEQWGWGSAAVLGLLFGSAIMFAVFVAVESKIKQPLVHLVLFKRKAFIVGNVGTFIVTWALIAALFFVSNYLQNFLLLDYSALKAGIGILPLGAGMFVASMISGRLVKIIGARWMLTLGMLLLAGGFFILVDVSRHSDYSDFWLPMAVCGIGLGLTFGPFSAIAVASADVKRAGEASGIVNMSRYAGAALGMAICTVLYNSAALNKLKAVFAELGLTGNAQKQLDQLVAGDDSIAKAEIEKLGSVKQAFMDGAAQAITDGFTAAMLATAVVCVVGAAVCFLLLSGKHRTVVPPAEPGGEE